LFILGREISGQADLTISEATIVTCEMGKGTTFCFSNYFCFLS
jgi:hypothetical protein